MTLARTKSRKECRLPRSCRAYLHRLLVPLNLQVPERIGISNHVTGIPVHRTCNLGVEQRRRPERFKKVTAGRNSPVCRRRVGTDQFAFKNHPGQQAVNAGIGQFHDPPKIGLQQNKWGH